MTEIHETEGDLESVIKVAESGLEVARRAEQSTGKTLPQYVCTRYRTTLLTAILFTQSKEGLQRRPRHRPRRLLPAEAPSPRAGHYQRHPREGPGQRALFDGPRVCA